MNIEHEETYKGCKIKLMQDTDARSPREDCNVGTMVCWHRLYNLGDEQPNEDMETWVRGNIEPATWEAEKERREYEIRSRSPRPDLAGSDEEREDSRRELNDALDAVESDMENDAELCRRLFKRDNIVLPLFLYDHSGISMSTGDFGDRWDSGQVGFIYCPMSTARKEWTGTDEEIQARAIARMEGEVRVYSSYLEGDVVGFVAEDPDGGEIDSCWGFFPDEREGYGKRWDYPLGEARAAVDRWVEQQSKEQSERAYWEARDTITK